MDRPIFPNPALADESFSAPFDMNGMSLREYYAGQALQGIMSGYWGNPEMSGLSPKDVANEAVQSADALIAELDKGLE